MPASSPTPTEVDILQGGTVSRRGIQGSFAQNVFFKNNTLEVRSGFGQVDQFNCSAGLPPVPATGESILTTKWGFQKHLGSKLFRTDFGHLQLVSVHLAVISSASAQIGTMGADVYVVTIYDIDQGTRWEEIIYRHTAENNTDVYPMPQWHGQYETTGFSNYLGTINIGFDYQDWIHAYDEPFFFQEYRDILFFGNSVSGLLAYRPCMFAGNTRKFLNKHDNGQWAPGYAESACVVRATPSPGLFEEAFAYFSKDEFPKTSCITQLEGRLIYASGKSVYFSDAGFPTNIAADNFITLESESDIVAISHIQGNLVILTANETWMYHPSPGFLWSQGRLQRISEYVGCVAPSAALKLGNKVWWWDVKGVYSTTGNTLVELESAAIDNYWDNQVSSPVSHYHTESGHVSDWASATQPTSYFRYAGGPVNITHDSVRDLIIFSVPDEDIAWVLCDGGEWCLWNFESVSYSDEGTPSVRAIKNVRAPWIESKEGRNLLVGGPESRTMVDSSSEGTHVMDSSYYILEYGRGGALDRSSYDHEDTPDPEAKYTITENDDTEARYYLGEWIPVDAGYTCPAGAVFATDGYLVPVYIAAPAGLTRFNPDRISIVVQFDSAYWKPVPINTSGEVDFIVPAERMASVSGYSQSSPAANSRFQVYDTGGASYDEDGNQLEIKWDGASGFGWNYAPDMNFNWGQKVLLCYIPMQRKASADDRNLAGMGWSHVSAVLSDVVGATSYDMQPTIWSQYWVHDDSRPKMDTNVQPVDWVYKSNNINETEAFRIKTRGLWIRTLSHGPGSSDDSVYSDYTPGLFGVAVAADGREYLAQAMAYTDSSEDATFRSAELLSRDIRTIQGQIRLGDGSLAEKVFDSADVTYGDISNSATGSYYIDDEEIMDQLISANMDGSRVAYVLYGSMTNRGQRLAIFNAHALVQVVAENARRVDRRV